MYLGEELWVPGATSAGSEQSTGGRVIGSGERDTRAAFTVPKEERLKTPYPDGATLACAGPLHHRSGINSAANRRAHT